MPDYLGKDQRKVKDSEEKDDKPFQGKAWTILLVIFKLSVKTEENS